MVFPSLKLEIWIVQTFDSEKFEVLSGDYEGK